MVIHLSEWSWSEFQVIHCTAHTVSVCRFGSGMPVGVLYHSVCYLRAFTVSSHVEHELHIFILVKLVVWHGWLISHRGTPWDDYGVSETPVLGLVDPLLRTWHVRAMYNISTAYASVTSTGDSLNSLQQCTTKILTLLLFSRSRRL